MISPTLLFLNLLLLLSPSKLENSKDLFFLDGTIDKRVHSSIISLHKASNSKIYPRLKSLLTKDYFRFYKVNLKRKCPFWHEENRCTIRHCNVKTCTNLKFCLGQNDYCQDFGGNDGYFDRKCEGKIRNKINFGSGNLYDNNYNKYCWNKDCCDIEEISNKGGFRNNRYCCEDSKEESYVKESGSNERCIKGICSNECWRDCCSKETCNKDRYSKASNHYNKAANNGGINTNQQKEGNCKEKIEITNGKLYAYDKSFHKYETVENKTKPKQSKHLSNSTNKNNLDNFDCNYDLNSDLDYLNTSLSSKQLENFQIWKAFDESQDNFCIIDDKDSDAEYVDLLLNPERYTGYKGPSAHKVWNSIYEENCFEADNKYALYIQSFFSNDCLEKRLFYKAISGLHTSTSIHLCAKYLKTSHPILGMKLFENQWGPNFQEFLRRFVTNSSGNEWLKNLYFIYSIELNALNKISNYLSKYQFYTGNMNEDFETQIAVKNLLKIISAAPIYSDVSLTMSGEDSSSLKQEFRLHFLNISKIMDCVGCSKCRLWGKLQIQGLGTALKILFSDKAFSLQRTEIVSLMNSLGRLATSVYELDMFKRMMVLT